MGTTPPRVGLVGLGNMGAAVAAHVRDAGYDLIVHDRRTEAMGEVAGAAPAASVADLGRASDVVLVVVVDDAQVRDVVLGPGGQDGLLSVLAPGSTVAVLSTVAPATCRELAEAAAAVGIGLVDAPLSGGPQGARAGQLCVMVGGEADHVERCRPVLESFAAQVFHLGPVGSGEVAKLLNNLVGLVALNATREALAVARAAGVDEPLLLQVVQQGSADCWAVRHWEEAQADVASSTTGPEGMGAMGVKDLRLVASLARDVGVPVPLADLATDLTRDLWLWSPLTSETTPDPAAKGAP